MTIKCGDGKTHIAGNALDIIQDFVNIICSVRESLKERYTEEEADEIIALCGQLAFAVSDGDKEREYEVLDAVARALTTS